MRRIGYYIAFFTLITLLFTTHSVVAQSEVVEVWNRDDNRGFSRYVGRVESFNRTGLVLKTPDGETTLSAHRVARITYRKSDAHQLGDLHFEQKNFRDAREHYKKARVSAERRWVEVAILERIVRCDVALGFYSQALLDFASLIELEPEMTDATFSCIPLAWRTIPGDRALEDTALRLLRENGKQPEICLLCASYLMFAPQGKEVQPRLKVLAGGKNQRVAALAEAQLWRTELMRVTSESVAQWRERIERLPPEYQAGPNFVLGQAYFRIKHYDLAALAFLKTAYLCNTCVYNTDDKLAVDAQNQAKKSLELGGHADEASRIK